MLENPEVYGGRGIDLEECKNIADKDVDKALARVATIPKRRNSGDLRTDENCPSVSMHSDLAGPIHPVEIGGM